MIKRYRVFASDGTEIGGTGCYTLFDVTNYCDQFGFTYTEEDYPEPPDSDPYYFLFDRHKQAQEWLK